MLPAQNGHSNMTRTCKEMQDPGQTDPHSQSVESWLSVSVTLDEGFLEDWGGGPPFFLSRGLKLWHLCMQDAL